MGAETLPFFVCQKLAVDWFYLAVTQINIMSRFVQDNKNDMARLFINKDIAADADKMMYWLSGDDCISFSDIQAFLDFAKDDERIDVELHSCGGSCIEGYAIYDALRASGKEISCTVVGSCASMATVILLAAPLERRAMYPNARLLIHTPYFPCFGDKATIESLESALNSLKSEKDRMLSIYVERTGKSKEELEAQMATDDWFGSDKAIELGFVSFVVPPASAKHSINPNNERMKAEKKKPSVAEAFKLLGVALGLTKAEGSEGSDESVEPVSLAITTVTGDELNVEREEGEIQVGDKASPDGEHVLEDGRTVVVVDGVISEIREASEEETEDENDTEGKAEEDEEKKALVKENNELKAQLEMLRGEMEALKSNAKSEEDARILAAVEKAGGESWLTKAAASTYVPAGRSNEKPMDNEKVSLVESKLAEARERNKKRYKKD